MKISLDDAGSKAVRGLATCWVFRKRSFSLSGNLAKLYSDEIKLHSNSNKALIGYKRLDNSGVLLTVTKWRIMGFMESEVVRWTYFRRLSNDEMAEIIEESSSVMKML